MKTQDYVTLGYPRSRVATFDVGSIGSRKHHITGLLEVDVTVAKGMLDEAIKSGRRVSFTSFMLKTIADMVAENSFIQAINYRGLTQIAFKDVDISLPIERKIEGRRVPLVTVIRKANEKTIDQISEEIRTAIAKPIISEREYVLENSGRLTNAFFFRLPQPFRLLIWKVLLSSPFSRKKTMGTVMVTNVSMSGRFPGWILPKSLHNLCFGIGAVVPKPWVIDGKIQIRDILNLTVMFDHDAIDGSPAARFVDMLVTGLEFPNAV